jgi:nucleotide-binding universal stress UspA family protein
MILVGIDDRPSAADALVLARWLTPAQSEELLLAWVHPYGRLPSLLEAGPEQGRVRRAIEAIAQHVRATLPRELRSELRLVPGRSAAEGLQQLADREQASLIVLGASERAGLGRIVPGSTARRLLSGSTAPVAIAPRGYDAERPGDPVLGVGYEGGRESEAALAYAADLARRIDGRLRVVAVHHPIAFSNVGAGAFPAESVGRALRRELHTQVEGAAADLETTLDVGTIFRDGDPASELGAVSRELDLLILGSRAYGPARSVLLGSVSEATIDRSSAPVVIVPRPA